MSTGKSLAELALAEAYRMVDHGSPRAVAKELERLGYRIGRVTDADEDEVRIGPWMNKAVRAHLEEWGQHQCGYDPCGRHILKQVRRLREQR